MYRVIYAEYFPSIKLRRESKQCKQMDDEGVSYSVTTVRDKTKSSHIAIRNDFAFS